MVKRVNNCGRMECFKCGMHLSDTKYISKHFLWAHASENIVKYICKYGACEVECSSLRSFTKHVGSHMRIFNDQPSTSGKRHKADTGFTQLSVQNCSDSIIVPKNMLENDNINAEVISKSTVKSGILFSLKLHSKNHFTRKDVIDVQHEVMESVVNPILTEVNSFFDKHKFGENLDTKLEFVDLINKILMI